jgi:hypothetical protein
MQARSYREGKMARYLVVAYQTAESQELLDQLSELFKDDPRAEFVLLVPATPVGYLLTWEEGEAMQLALHRAQTALATFRMLGIPMYESHIGDASPLKAIEDELQRRRYAAVVISTLPPGLSEWLKTDLPTQVAHQHPRLKVMHVVSQPSPVQVDWPRAVAYFGGLAAAVAVGVVEWPLGVVLAAFPIFRMVHRRRLPGAVRLAIGLAEDVARPVIGEVSGPAHLTRSYAPVMPPKAAPTNGRRSSTSLVRASRGVILSAAKDALAVGDGARIADPSVLEP